MTKKNETTSPRVATIASKALHDPKSVTLQQIKAMAASLLTQAPDKGNKK